MFNQINKENMPTELRALCPELRSADMSLIRTLADSCARHHAVLGTNYSGALMISLMNRAPMATKLADVVRRCQMWNSDEQAFATDYKLLCLEEEAEELEMLQEALRQGRDRQRSVIISLSNQAETVTAPRYRNFEEYQNRMAFGNAEMDDLEAMA